MASVTGQELTYNVSDPYTEKADVEYNALDMDDINQSVQNMIYALNSNSRAGSEPAFTNITLDFKVLKPMQDLKVIVGGEEKENFTYKQFQKEADILTDVFSQIMYKGDSNKNSFSYPIPTFNISKGMDWDNPMYEYVWKSSAKYGTPYFGNFLHGVLQEDDVFSMAILGTQNVIYKNQEGRIAINEIRNLVNNWIKAKDDNKPEYKILMSGKFIDIIDMFKVPYDKYDKYVKFILQNNYTQLFSMDHETMILRDGKFIQDRSQRVTTDDSFLISCDAYEGEVGNYKAGKILGYYLAEGWKSTAKSSIFFAININREDIKNEIVDYFESFGCRVVVDRRNETSIFHISVYGHQAYGFIDNFISGDTAKTKKMKNKIWNTTIEFRKGLFEGVLETDGHKKRNILMHTTNKSLTDDLIKLSNSIGILLTFRQNDKNTRYFKPDKSDYEVFTSYELQIANHYKKYKYNDKEYYIVPIKEVKLISSKGSNTVYNFTVNTEDHLYELPNGIITHQCCRLRLDRRELVNKTGGLFGAAEKTGSLGVFTISLPVIAYKAKGKSKTIFFNELNRKMELGKKHLILKKMLLNDMLDRGAYPALKEYLGNFNTMFMTIGMIGANEMCLNYLGKGINTEEGREFTQEVIDFMKNKLSDFQETTGELFNLEATPAEGATYRLAKAAKEHHEGIITAGTEDRPYFTNSVHLPVDIEWSYNDIYNHQHGLLSSFTGGSVYHNYLKHSLSGEAVKEQIKIIFENYDIPYLSNSPLYSICETHGFLEGKHDFCPECYKPVDVYQRITGYIRKIENFNDGKAQEFAERYQKDMDLE